MRRVLTNIGANAVKFVPKNGRVTFDIQREDSGIRILIMDNGYRGRRKPQVIDP